MGDASESVLEVTGFMSPPRSKGEYQSVLLLKLRGIGNLEVSSGRQKDGDLTWT